MVNAVAVVAQCREQRDQDAVARAGIENAHAALQPERDLHEAVDAASEDIFQAGMAQVVETPLRTQFECAGEQFSARCRHVQSFLVQPGANPAECTLARTPPAVA